MVESLVQIANLVVTYKTGDETVLALDGVNLEIAPGSCFGVVGESGCGKSTLSSALGRMLPTNAVIESETMCVANNQVYNLNGDALRQYRKNEIAYVFQEPVSVLNPTKTIGNHFKGVLADENWQTTATQALHHVGLHNSDALLSSFPHQLSGGMAQRAVIAMALIRKPKLLIADEPTASLDASIRHEVMNVIINWCREIGAGIIIISHDIPLISKYCDNIGIIYAGRFVETGETKAIVESPQHPYTQALFSSEPGSEGPGGKLVSLRGSPPILNAPAKNCAFAPRCKESINTCSNTRPEMVAIAGGQVACFNRDPSFKQDGL